MMERTDNDGRWTSDDGVAWQLVEPSQAYLDRQAVDTAAADVRQAATEAVRQAERDLAAAQQVAARLAAVDKVKADALTDAEVASLAPLFDPWQPGGIYALGDVRRWDGTLIRCLQGHTNADPNHTPDTTSALWTIYRAAPTGYPAWVQPESTNPYNLLWDDGTGPVIVTHNGRLWENLVDGNVWVPGAVGTESLWADLGPV